MFSAKIHVNINKDISQEIMQQLDQGLDDIADLVFARSQELCPVDEATLKKSGHVEREYLHKTIEYDAPHAAYQEFGTRPHYPPIQPIRDWVWHKRADLGITDKEVNRVAYMIQQKIGKEGTEPQPFLRPSLDEGISKAQEIISRRIK